MEDGNISIENVDDIVTTEEQSEDLTENATDIKEDPQKQIKHTKLPMHKIKSIMKMDPDVSLVSNDAVFAVTKATELFIESLVKEAYSYTAKGKRKTVSKKDFDNVIETVDCLCFLEGAMDIQ